MGWGTNFKPKIYLSKQTYPTMGILSDSIEELEEDIQNHKASILMYVSSNPNDIIPDDWKEDGVVFLQNKINDLLETLEEDMNNLQLLRLFKQHIEENDLNIEEFDPHKNEKF